MTTKERTKRFQGIFSFILILLLMEACSPAKKKETSKVTFPKAEYALSTDSLPFTFDISNQAKLTWQKNKPGEYFCNVDYPQLNARLYCTFHLITPDKFRVFAEESRKMAYQHTAVATGIKEKAYSNDTDHRYGILYDIQGNVATPIQVALTDSSHYFFNASLYFNTTTNSDSIAPVVNYIRQDIIRIMETLTVKSH